MNDFKRLALIIHHFLLPVKRHLLAGIAGFEPADAGVKVLCLNRLGYIPFPFSLFPFPFSLFTFLFE